MKRLLISLILIFCLAAPALAGSQYYIDPSSSFTISASSGSLTPFEWITQSGGAQAIYCFTNGTTVTVCAVLGTPATGTWTGALSGSTVTASNTPTANGSNSNAGTQAAPWQTCQHATGAETGSQAGTTFYIRAQTVCYNDTFLFNCYGSNGNPVTLTSYVANAGDGTLNPRIYAATCLPTGSGYGLWTATTSPATFSNVYQASSSMLSPTGYGTGIYWDDWYHASPYPGSNGVGTGAYSGQWLEQYFKNPNPSSWYTGNNLPLQTSASNTGLNNASAPTLNAGGSGYPDSSTFNVYVNSGNLAGQLSVSTNGSGVVTTINGVVQDGSTGGDLKGGNYSTASGVATYSPSGGSGFTVNIASGNLTTISLTDVLAMVDTYSRTLYYYSTGPTIYIHNPMVSGNPATTAGTNIWVPQYMHAIGIAGAGVSYITVNGIDGYYCPVVIGTDDNQIHFANNCIIENCNSAFASIDYDITGSNQQWTNCNISYYGWAGFCPFDTGTSNPGYQTDQIFITNCGDNYPVISSQFGAPIGLYLDFPRSVAYGLTWTNSGYSGWSVGSPPGAGGGTNSTILNATWSSGTDSAATSNITTVNQSVYTTLFNYNGTGQVPTLSLTGGTINRGGTLAQGWNTVVWTATGSTAYFTISSTTTATFSLTPRASHQIMVNGYSMYNPTGSKTVGDYYEAIYTYFATNSTISNVTLNGQAEAYMWCDKYSLNITMNGLNQQSAINGTPVNFNYTDGFAIERCQLYGSGNVLALNNAGTPAASCSSVYPQIINNNVLACSSASGTLVYFSSAPGGNYNPTYINNNTLYEPSRNGTGIQIIQDTAPTYIYNNIFENLEYVFKSSAATVASLHMDYNQPYNWYSADYAYYNSAYKTQAAWITAGFDTHSSTANTTAKLVNPGTSPGSTVNFRLNWGSPAINAGTTPPAGAPTQDALYTNYNGLFWDQGAYQWKRGMW